MKVQIMRRYALSSYDDNLCLKPPVLLWVGVVYLSRAISLPIAMGVARLIGVSPDSTDLLRGLWSLYTLVPSLFAAAVLYAMFRRQPSASRGVRWIWAHGRTLLAVSAVVDAGLVILALLKQTDADTQALPSLCVAALDLYFMLYVLAARRVRDVFTDFPLPATVD